MILKEKDLEQYRKKMVLDSFFKYEYGSDNITLGFNAYYDCGEGKGIVSPTNDDETLNFAKKIRGNSNVKINDIFYIGGDNEYVLGNFGNGLGPINNEKNRQLILKKLYAFGLSTDIKVFMQVDDDYFFINEIKFLPKEEQSNMELSNEKIEELDQFVQNHMYGKDYDNFKKQETFANITKSM